MWEHLHPCSVLVRPYMLQCYYILMIETQAIRKIITATDTNSKHKHEYEYHELLRRILCKRGCYNDEHYLNRLNPGVQ